MEKEHKFRSGFVSIIGRPNAGKSTLLNAILGEKVSIVSEKPQTTRNVIRGVKNLPGCQIVFIDTPGIHKAKGLLNEFMVKEALSSLSGVDVILYMVDAGKVTEDDEFIIEGLKNIKIPVFLAINKVDRVDKREVLPIIERFSKSYPFREIVPISALKGDGVDMLADLISKLLPEGPQYFPGDILTDQPERFIVSELIREQIFKFTSEEVPYSVAVTIDKFKEKKDIIEISATINVERDSQKGILIGKKGAMLKRIGTGARMEIEKLLGSRVFLELFVRVQKSWTKSIGALEDFGYKKGG